MRIIILAILILSGVKGVSASGSSGGYPENAWYPVNEAKKMSTCAKECPLPEPSEPLVGKIEEFLISHYFQPSSEARKVSFPFILQLDPNSLESTIEKNANGEIVVKIGASAHQIPNYDSLEYVCYQSQDPKLFLDKNNNSQPSIRDRICDIFWTNLTSSAKDKQYISDYFQQINYGAKVIRKFFCEDSGLKPELGWEMLNTNRYQNVVDYDSPIELDILYWKFNPIRTLSLFNNEPTSTFTEPGAHIERYSMTFSEPEDHRLHKNPSPWTDYLMRASDPTSASDPIYKSGRRMVCTIRRDMHQYPQLTEDHKKTISNYYQYINYCNENDPNSRDGSMIDRSNLPVLRSWLKRYYNISPEQLDQE